MDALTTAELLVHPAAEAFPMLPADELQALADDIAANGLNHPIMLDAEGLQLIDGRNRLKACGMAGVEPRYDCLPVGVDPLAYIVSENINRRHLSKGQQALALALIYPQGERGRGKIDPARKSLEASGFSEQRLRQARQIVRYPDLVDMVRSGAIRFDDALADATQRATAESNATYYLDQLDAEAADLAAQVREEKLSMREAWAAFEARKKEVAEKERNRRDACLRIMEGAYRSCIASAQPEFVASLEQYLTDTKFREEMTTRLRIGVDGAGTLADMQAGSKALGRLLKGIAP